MSDTATNTNPFLQALASAQTAVDMGTSANTQPFAGFGQAINPPESALPPPPVTTAPETTATAPKRKRRTKAEMAAARGVAEEIAAEMTEAILADDAAERAKLPVEISDTYARTLLLSAALTGAFSNPQMLTLSEKDFARFVRDRVDAIEAQEGSRGVAK